MQVVYTKFIKVVLTDYSALVQAKWFKNKLQQPQVKKKEGKKEESMWNLGLEKEKNVELYGTLPLEGEYNYDIVLRMTSWKLWRNISAD